MGNGALAINNVMHDVDRCQIPAICGSLLGPPMAFV